jgi:hypothetical protein
MTVGKLRNPKGENETANEEDGDEPTPDFESALQLTSPLLELLPGYHRGSALMLICRARSNV